MIVVFLLAVVICLPALGLLYYLDQRSLLESEGPEPGEAASRPRLTVPTVTPVGP